MNRDQHKNEIKRKVLRISRDLFMKRGYTKTTIKDITQTAGITTGSLYHFFNGKQDILLHLTKEVFDSAAIFADLMAKKEAAPGLRFALEIGIQLYLVQKYDTIAELYLAAHESADIARVIVESALIRNQGLFQSYCPEFTSEQFYAAALAVKGIFHSYAQESVYNKQNISTTLLFSAIEMMLALFQIPGDEIKKTIQTAHALIKEVPLSLFNLEVP